MHSRFKDVFKNPSIFQINYSVIQAIQKLTAGLIEWNKASFRNIFQRKKKTLLNQLGGFQKAV